MIRCPDAARRKQGQVRACPTGGATSGRRRAFRARDETDRPGPHVGDHSNPMQKCRRFGSMRGQDDGVFHGVGRAAGVEGEASSSPRPAGGQDDLDRLRQRCPVGAWRSPWAVLQSELKQRGGPPSLAARVQCSAFS